MDVVVDLALKGNELSDYLHSEFSKLEFIKTQEYSWKEGFLFIHQDVWKIENRNKNKGTLDALTEFPEFYDVFVRSSFDYFLFSNKTNIYLKEENLAFDIFAGIHAESPNYESAALLKDQVVSIPLSADKIIPNKLYEKNDFKYWDKPIAKELKLDDSPDSTFCKFIKLDDVDSINILHKFDPSLYKFLVDAIFIYSPFF
ncbi:hypothetical protein K9L97_02440 [Candidatus Woesearchaeota archaeon]|nr:hypothetical protein [Candidatus Woesearchaeota archaeon]